MADAPTGRPTRSGPRLLLAALVALVAALTWALWPAGSVGQAALGLDEPVALVARGPGEILALGGFEGRARVMRSLDGGRRWVEAPDGAAVPRGGRAVRLAGGALLTVGTDGAWRLDPGAERFRRAASPPQATLSHTLTALPDGRALLAGGLLASSSDLKAVATVARYDPEADAWEELAPLWTPRTQHTATLLPDGRVLLAGGVHPGVAILDDCERYDPVAGTSVPAAKLQIARMDHAAVALADGQVLVIGGADSWGSPREPWRLAERYDPTHDAWAPAGETPQGRRAPAAVRLDDGRVWVVGGAWRPNRKGWKYYAWRLREELLGPPPEHPASTFFYDPDAGRWSDGPEVDGGVMFPFAVALPEGGALVVGAGRAAWLE